MSQLDETDLEILRLLIEDARRPYSDVAERVDLSPPTVSDRIDRLVELGVIERFTADVNRSALSGGTSVLVEIRARPGRVKEIMDVLETEAVVEHIYVTVDARVTFTATIDEPDIRETVFSGIDDAIDEFDVRLLADESWNPVPPDVSLVLTCDECGNTVTSEGESALIGGKRYHFCCPSCQSRFETRYDELSETEA